MNSVNRVHPSSLSLLLLAVCLLLQPLPQLHAEPAKQKKHCLWVVRGKSNSVYLFGSVHVLKKEFYPLPKPIEEAYRKSAKVVFEINMDDAASPDAQKKAEAAQRLPPGKTLEGQLSKETYKSLVTHLKKHDIAPEALEKMQPWSVALLLGLLEWQQLGYSGEAGVEKYFADKAKLDGKEIGALETVEFQLSLFTGLTKEEQEAVLKETLAEMSTAKDMIDDLLAAWKVGDLAALDKVINEGMRSFPELQKKLIDDRNKQWIGQIEEMLKGDKDIFIAVGAGHLGGENGVLQLLKAKGYRIKQL